MTPGLEVALPPTSPSRNRRPSSSRPYLSSGRKSLQHGAGGAGGSPPSQRKRRTRELIRSSCFSAAGAGADALSIPELLRHLERSVDSSWEDMLKTFVLWERSTLASTESLQESDPITVLIRSMDALGDDLSSAGRRLQGNIAGCLALHEDIKPVLDQTMALNRANTNAEGLLEVLETTLTCTDLKDRTEELVTRLLDSGFERLEPGDWESIPAALEDLVQALRRCDVTKKHGGLKWADERRLQVASSAAKGATSSQTPLSQSSGSSAASLGCQCRCGGPCAGRSPHAACVGPSMPAR